MTETLSERLREEAMTLAWTAWSRMDGGHECTMSASLAEEAADTIDALVEALSPFAKAGELFTRYPIPDGSVASIYAPAAGPEYSLSSDHLIAARAALAKAKGGDNG